MLGHNVTSPLLFGVASSNGFSSNADELKNSSNLFDNMVIRPIQDEILEALDDILSFNGISLKLFFKTLQPLEFADLENAMTDEQVAEETGQDVTQLSAQNDDNIANELIKVGHDADHEWLLIDEFAVDYDNDDLENEMLSKEVEKSLLSKAWDFISTGRDRPNITSKQDKIINQIKYLTRYVYAGETTEKSRAFCRKMIDAKKIYRKEDIVAMESQIVNNGWGPKGVDTYDIWKYKGGGSCHHRWNKQVYATLSGTGLDINSGQTKQIAQAKASRQGYVVKNEAFVTQLPVNMPNQGFLPSNKRFK
jgi:hypothetical protein